MRRIAAIAGVLAVAVLVAPAGAVNVSNWRACRGEPVVRVHNITCALGKKIARYGFRPGTLRTWIGGFHCMRQRNAENVIWLYTCIRHHGHDGVFFPAPTAGLSGAVVALGIVECGHFVPTGVRGGTWTGYWTYRTTYGFSPVWNLTTRRVGCSLARRFSLAESRHFRRHRQGFTCRKHAVPDTNNEEYDIRCVAGSRVIHWQGGV